MQQFVNKNINTQYWYFLNDSFAIWRKISIKKVIFHTKQNLLLDQSTWWRHKYFTFLIAMSAFPWKIRYDNSLNILETRKFDMRELSKMYDFSNNCITTQMFLCKKVVTNVICFIIKTWYVVWIENQISGFRFLWRSSIFDLKNQRILFIHIIDGTLQHLVVFVDLCRQKIIVTYLCTWKCCLFKYDMFYSYIIHDNPKTVTTIIKMG